MNRIAVFITIVCFLATGVLAQDPLKVAPNNYKLEFENDWVKVVRVRYGAHEQVPAHDHTETGSAYVYLSDSGPVTFKHTNTSYGPVTRAAVKAGSFRLWYAVKEIHEVENPNDTPSEFLRIEFKTEPLGGKSLRGKFYREEAPAGENLAKVQFDNEQVRATRLIIAPGKKLDVTAGANEPALLVAITPAQLKATNAKGKSAKWDLALGKTSWMASGEKQTLENVGKSPAELLRFDLKTRPVKSNPNEKEKPHAHPHD